MTIDSFIREVRRDHTKGKISAVPGASDYDEFYYRNCCGQPYERNELWLGFFGKVADRIVSDMQPKRVLDAGCAIGLLVETLRARGVDATGIDLSTWAIEHATEAAKPHVREGSIVEPFDRQYDLIVCIEVLEHMPPEEAEKAIANFAAHTGDVLFSSTPFDYKEPTHVNVRMPEDWAEAFARHGFYRDVDYDASFITKWAARFTRRSVPTHRLVRDYERRYWQLRAAEHDARTYSVEVQDRLAAAEERRAGLEKDLTEAGNALSEAHRQTNEVHRVLDEVRADLTAQLAAANRMIRGLQEQAADLEADANELKHKLGASLDTIRHMESSAFWRARLLLNRLMRRR
jgi:SAM-dependent methyltransferase